MCIHAGASGARWMGEGFCWGKREIGASRKARKIVFFISNKSARGAAKVRKSCDEAPCLMLFFQNTCLGNCWRNVLLFCSKNRAALFFRQPKTRAARCYFVPPVFLSLCQSPHSAFNASVRFARNTCHTFTPTVASRAANTPSAEKTSTGTDTPAWIL